ncbi:MAG: Gfo/Idh/MocA family oxidoreductase [Caldilineaceae bacterium]|nr:Gfo/Idh/MocA family oxidoreductase [Caldilineaceae bacterium]
MTAKIYRVAIVGLGRMGSTIDDEMAPGSPPYSIAAACRDSERLEVVAGADIDPAKRAAFQARWGVSALYEDYLEMIAKEKPDMVAICTRGDLHAEMAVKTAEAGVPMIYCEKAIACSGVENDAVLTAVQSNGTLFNTGVLRRFNRVFHQAKALIAQGEIGEPRAAVHYAASNLLHGHIHSLDSLSFLLGDPKIVSVWGELFPRDLVIENNRLDKDPNSIFHVVFENGVEATTALAGSWEFEILGTQGSVRVLGGDGLLLRKSTGVRGQAWVTTPVPDIPPHSTTQFCLEDLVGALEEGRPTLGNIEVTHHLTEACLAVAESHRVKERVTLPLTNKDLYIFHR